MLRKLTLSLAAAGALGLVAFTSAPADAAALRSVAGMSTVQLESPVIEAQHWRWGSRRGHWRWGSRRRACLWVHTRRWSRWRCI
jgi:hypothetical protein